MLSAIGQVLPANDYLAYMDGMCVAAPAEMRMLQCLVRLSNVHSEHCKPNVTKLVLSVRYNLSPGESGADDDVKAVAHPGYQVERPFTMLRYVLVGVLVEIIDRDPEQLDALPVELWKVLCSWFFQYPHNNLYHAVFYKLVFKALRSNHVNALRMAVSKGRLVGRLVNSHVGGDKVGITNCRG